MKHNYLKRVSSLLLMLFCISCINISMNTNSSIFNKVPTATAFAYTIANPTIIEETRFSNIKKNSENEFINETDVWTAMEYIQDEADILTDAEEAELWASCMSTSKENDISIFILTTNSVPTNRKLYIEDFYDTNVNSILTDSVIILVNMDPNNRGVEIQGYGLCEFSISDDRIEKILDEIVPFLSAGEYYGAFSTYIFEVDKYMSIEATSDYVHTEEDNLNYNENYYYEEETGSSFVFNLLISAGIAAIIVIIMLVNSKGKVTVNRNTYMDPKTSRLLGHWDRYIRTTTTKRRKPQENHSSGGGSRGGGGGVSRGGHSHSGGGRSF